MKKKLKTKVIGLAVAAALLPMLVMSVLTFAQKSRIHDTLNAELKQYVRDNAAQIARNVFHMCETTNRVLETQALHNLKVASLLLKEKGGLSLSADKKTLWKATNQFTRKAVSDDLPAATVGGALLKPGLDNAARLPVVDQTVNLVGGTCTIFQRMNESGDMLRVATNVMTADNRRAIGTYIPAVRPDGSADPVIAKVVKRGETYNGPAYVVNSLYITAYEPIRNAEGATVGMLYVGVKIEAIGSLRKVIKDIVVGKTGYVYVLGGHGERKGAYIIAKKLKAQKDRDGENIWDTRASDGTPFIQNIVTAATKLPPKRVGYDSYPWKNPGDPAPRMKTTAFTYFKPWDWVIAAGAYSDDYRDAERKIDYMLNIMLIVWMGIGLVLLAVITKVAFVVGAKIADPISAITEVTQIIARGDLHQATADLDALGDPALIGQDETGRLIAAVGAMTGNLNSLVGQVQRSGIQVTSSTTQIAASARELEATTAEQAASTSEVVGAAKEISATSQGLAETVAEVTDVTADTAALAGAGQADLAVMLDTMRQLADATRSISARLSAINEKANNISSVGATISKVADQTNLLSLNAAIEAEKAGEYGQGFSVVAREIRRLADQTAIATLDIDEMVKEMQSAVSAGVMEMDKFSEEMRRSLEETDKISARMAQIIEQVQALTPRFETVSDGARAQSESARQISDSMVQLNEAAQQTAQSLREFNSVIKQLNEASRGLQNEVSQFRVSS